MSTVSGKVRKWLKSRQFKNSYVTDSLGEWIDYGYYNVTSRLYESLVTME